MYVYKMQCWRTTLKLQSAKEPYVSAKEPYITAKDTYITAKES